MPAPSVGRELHIDQPLSNVLVNRRPEGFIADQLLPVTNVNKQSDVYYKFLNREWIAYEENLSNRAPGTEAKNVVFSVSSDTYFAKNYALKNGITIEDEVNADEVLQMRTSMAEHLGDRLMTDYEVRVANIAVATANVGTVTTITSAWSDPAVALAMTDLLRGREQFRLRSGAMPNLAIVPQNVFTWLQLNDQLRAYVFGSNNGGVLSQQQLATILGVERVLIPRAQQNTATEYATVIGSGTRTDIWGNHFWFAKVNLLSGRMTDTWLNAFRWVNPAFGTPMAIRVHPFDSKKLVQEIEASYYQDEKVVSNDLAVRIANVVST